MAVSQPEIRFQKFEIIECLKKDTHGSVFLAHHVFLSKKIILKTLQTVDLPDPARLKRFQREARILARLDHPAIIKVLDFGTVGDEFYISFEYFPSVNLRKFLQQNNPADDIRRQLATQLLEGIRFAHQNGIVHRDIKPENILIGEKGQLKIADFGLAQVMQEERVTIGSAIVGTPGYMSPEQISGARVTPQSDLFSIGIVILEIFSGKNPFLGADLATTLNNIASKADQISTAALIELPAETQPIIRKLLRRQTDLRYADAAQVIADWPAIVSSGKSSAQMLDRRFYGAGVAVILVVVLGIAYFLFWQKPAAILQKSAGEPSTELKAIGNSVETPDLQSVENPVNKETRQKNGEISNDLSEQKNVLPVDPQPTSDSNPDEDTVPAPTTAAPEMGQLMVRCLPWARVFVDGKPHDLTPLKEPIELAPGKHILRLVNPGFPVYDDTLTIIPGEVNTFAVKMDTLFGFLNLRVYPWATVEVDGQERGTTPLQGPLPLQPGNRVVVLRNPTWTPFRDTIYVTRRDTLDMQWNFQSSGKTN